LLYPCGYIYGGLRNNLPLLYFCSYCELRLTVKKLLLVNSCCILAIAATYATKAYCCIPAVYCGLRNNMPLLYSRCYCDLRN
jgi:hypothetical protein